MAVGDYDNFYQDTAVEHIVRQQAMERARYNMYQQLAIDPQYLGSQDALRNYLDNRIGGSLSAQSETSPQKTLQLIKKSIKEIRAEAVSSEMQEKIGSKINRLKSLGATAQAIVLEEELKLRTRLARVMEWDYKVLPATEIGKFNDEHRMTATKDGLKIHVTPLKDYVGNTTIETDKKDMVIPDFVLDKLDEAKQRQVFDDYSVLWVEKVKDPLLLGMIAGCKDFFFIAEWGDDIKFDDIVKEKK